MIRPLAQMPPGLDATRRNRNSIGQNTGHAGKYGEHTEKNRKFFFLIKKPCVLSVRLRVLRVSLSRRPKIFVVCEEFDG